MKYIILPALLIALASCNGKKEEPIVQQEIPQEIQEMHAPVAGVEVNDEFREFLERFSTDSLFQREHVQFPLKFTHAGHPYGRDTTFTVAKTRYASVDLINPGDDHFGQPTEVKTKMQDDNNATVTISGERSGILIEFFFELVEGKWRLKEVIDSSI